MKHGVGFSVALAAAGAWVLASCTPATEQTTAPTPAEAPITLLAQDPALQWGACPDIFPSGCEIAVLHGNPGQPNADVFLRVPGGYSLPAHSHTSVERMVLVSGELNVHYEGAEATSLSVGEYAFGPAGLPHEGACVSMEPCTLFIAFEGPVDAIPFEGTIQ